MWIFFQDSLQLGPPQDQNGLSTPPNCFPSAFSTLGPASMEDQAKLSFTLNPLANSALADSRPPKFEPGDDSSALYQRPSDASRYFPANNSKICHSQNLQPPQMSCDFYQPQGYCLPGEIQQNDPRRYPMASMYNYNQMATMGESPSSCPTSPTLEHSPAFGWPSPDMLKREDAPSPFIPRHDEDEDNSYDKPYARLIYEALMQAPGHRMMLREIYDWFLRNTAKPKESGSNGWQNSIRHNLSMNQAFENDKSGPSNRGGHARKSNSMWILTDLAIQNGVQSTTRYRKTGSAKKTNVNRVPALQRQRSGAKGGQAARRAAKLRRREQQSSRNQLSPMQSSPSISSYGYGDAYAQIAEGDYLSAYNPTTPSDDRLFGMSSVLPLAPYPAELPTFKMEEGFGEENKQSMYDVGLHDLSLHASDYPCIEDLLRLHHEPTSSSISP